MASGTELERLLNSLNFENQQYLHEIEKEHQTLAKLQQEMQELNRETQHLNNMKSRLDEDCRHFHKQFLQNKDILESQKSTLRMMEEHDAASRLKLQQVIEEGQRTRKEEQEQLCHYQNIADRYRTKYESFQYVQKLRQEEERLRQSQRKLQEEENRLKAMKFKIEQIQRAKGKNAPVPLNEWIVKLAELYVRTLHTRNEIQEKERYLQELQQKVVERHQQIAIEKQEKEEEERRSREAMEKREMEERAAQAQRAQEEALLRAEELHQKLFADDKRHQQQQQQQQQAEQLQQSCPQPMLQMQQRQQQQLQQQQQQQQHIQQMQQLQIHQQDAQKQQVAVGQDEVPSPRVNPLPKGQAQIQMPVIRTPQIGIPQLSIPHLSVPQRQTPRGFPAVVTSHTASMISSYSTPTQIAPPQISTPGISQATPTVTTPKLRNMAQRQPSYISNPLAQSSPRSTAPATDYSMNTAGRIVSRASPAKRSAGNIISPSKYLITPNRPAAVTDGDEAMCSDSPEKNSAKQGPITPTANKALTPKTPEERQSQEIASAKKKALMAKSPSDGFTYRPMPPRSHAQGEKKQEYTKEEMDTSDDLMEPSSFFMSFQPQQTEAADGAGDPGNGLVINQDSMDSSDNIPNSAGGDNNNFNIFGGEGQPFSFDFGIGSDQPSRSGDDEMFMLFGGSDNGPTKPSSKENFFDFNFDGPASPQTSQESSGFKLF